MEPQTNSQNDWTPDTQFMHATTIRELWRHENELIHARFTWFTTSQALLFTGLGFAWKDGGLLVVWLLSILGVIIALSTMAAFKLGWHAKEKLNKWWQDNLAAYDGPPITGDGINGRIKIPLIIQLSIWFRPWAVVPVAFALTWFAIILYVAFHGLQPVW